MLHRSVPYWSTSPWWSTYFQFKTLKVSFQLVLAPSQSWPCKFDSCQSAPAAISRDVPVLVAFPKKSRPLVFESACRLLECLSWNTFELPKPSRWAFPVWSRMKNRTQPFGCQSHDPKPVSTEELERALWKPR